MSILSAVVSGAGLSINEARREWYNVPGINERYCRSLLCFIYNLVKLGRKSHVSPIEIFKK